MLTLGKRLPLLLAMALTIMMLTQSLGALQAAAATRVSEFTLANGMQVVVIPDHRAPVVTHYVWYRVGRADEPEGVSGIAHFLEHLMFKSTDKIASGDFSKTVARLGGQDNAFTTQDMTGYFQRISKDRLKTMMEMEADRMINLRLAEKEVATERDVIIEERRSRTENVPASILSEQMSAVLYLNHPYRIPVIGWMHEMQKLSREDALTFYKRFYAPQQRDLGGGGRRQPRRGEEARRRDLRQDPSQRGHQAARASPGSRAARAARVELKDPRAGNASLRRYYLAPAFRTAAPGEPEALSLLLKIAGQGSTSRLYQALVSEEKLAANAGGWYSASGLDSGSIGLYAVAAEGVPLDKLEAAMDRVLHELREKTVSADELDRAKKAYIADFIYETDNQALLARRYGEGLIMGQTIAEIDNWPKSIAKVTAEDVKRAAIKYFDLRASVTGTLIPVPPEAESAAALKPAVEKSVGRMQ